MGVSFVRQIAKQAGVQLNPLQDNSELPIVGTPDDQKFATAMRCNRGRIDRPFAVNRGNVERMLGKSGNLRQSDLNKAFINVVEALNNGATEAVIQRLVDDTAHNKFIVATSGTTTTMTPTIVNGVVNGIQVTAQGTGYPHPVIAVTGGTGGIFHTTVRDFDGKIIKIEGFGGTGYANGKVVTISGASGIGAAATLSNVKGGSLTGATFTLTNGGSGYPFPDVSIAGGAGAQNYHVTTTNGGKVIAIVPVRIAGGALPFGFTVTSVITIAGTGGTGATAKIMDTNNGVINEIAINQTVGEVFTTEPNVSIITLSGGFGKGARAYVIVNDSEITDVRITNGGENYTPSKVKVTASQANNIEYVTANALPTTDPFMFAFKHHECFNDGIYVKVHADAKRVGGVNIANDIINLQILDNKQNVIYDFIGSLKQGSQDDYGNSTYLPDVISRATDNIDFYIGQDSAVRPSSDAYGFNTNRQLKWASSQLLRYFYAGEDDFTNENYQTALSRLTSTHYNYAYISTCDSENLALIGELVQLAYDTNRQLKVDIPGRFTVEEAITFTETLNLSSNVNGAHLIQYFWMPVKADDYLGLNGKIFQGGATLNAAYNCGKNAVTNDKGFAKKNYPVAGRNFPINRRGLVQTYFPTEEELSNLAEAKINPVVFETYTGGSLCVFRDCLTAAPVENSLKKLASVTDMSTSIDDAVTRFANDVLQLPMKIAVKKMTDFLRYLFEGAYQAGWLVKSSDWAMGADNRGFIFTVKPNTERPYDRLDVSYTLLYDGVARQIMVTQTYSKP